MPRRRAQRAPVTATSHCGGTTWSCVSVWLSRASCPPVTSGPPHQRLQPPRPMAASLTTTRCVCVLKQKCGRFQYVWEDFITFTAWNALELHKNNSYWLFLSQIGDWNALQFSRTPCDVFSKWFSKVHKYSVYNDVKQRKAFLLEILFHWG